MTTYVIITVTTGAKGTTSHFDERPDCAINFAQASHVNTT